MELTSEESDISEYIKFHLKKEKQLKCIGDIYENSYQYDKADKLYKSMIKRI